MVERMLNSPTTYGISPTSKRILNSLLSSLDVPDLTESLSLSADSAVEAAAFEERGGVIEPREVRELGC